MENGYDTENLWDELISAIRIMYADTINILQSPSNNLCAIVKVSTSDEETETFTILAAVSYKEIR